MAPRSSRFLRISSTGSAGSSSRSRLGRRGGTRKLTGESSRAADDQRAVLGSETDAVAERVRERRRPGGVRDVVEVALGIRLLQVDRRRKEPVAHAENGGRDSGRAA